MKDLNVYYVFLPNGKEVQLEATYFVTAEEVIYFYKNNPAAKKLVACVPITSGVFLLDDSPEASTI